MREGRRKRRRRDGVKRKKKSRRRRNMKVNANEKKEDITVILNNVKGYGSKKESIKSDILQKEQPDVCLVNETLLRGNGKINIEKYFSFCKNREVEEGKEKKGGGEGGGGGGVATLVACHLRPHTVKVGEGREGDEYIIVRLDNVLPALNIVNIYGENEKRAGEPSILNAWLRLKKDINEIIKKGEMILIMGDWNRAMGADKWGVSGNKPYISPGGQLIREQLLETGDFTLLNSLELCQGGPFTWQQAGKGEVKSCLDLALASANLLPFVKCMIIDKERDFTARRIIKKKSGTITIYTDHYAVKVILTGLPRRQGEVQKEITWNLNKPGGWDTYERLTKEAADKVKQVVEEARGEGHEADKVMKKIDSIENEIKFKAFGKTKPPTRKKMSEKKLLSEDELLRKQSQAIEDEILKIQEASNNRIGRVYKMKAMLMGGKKERQEPAAIRDPKDNELIVAPKEIKKVTLDYCVSNLKKRECKQEESHSRNLKEKLHQMRMKEEEDEGFELLKEDFDEVLKKFGKKSTKAYDMILKSSDRYKEAIFEVCKLFIEKEDFPEKFRKTTLHMIKKKKGSAEVLKQNRFIHMKEYLPRTCEALVVGKMKSAIMEKSTIYQIGGQSGHSLEEHVFSLKSLIGLREHQGEGLILSLVDIIAFFDREDILDVMETLNKKETNKKAARLWFKLNDNTEISVKTAVGVSSSADVGALVGQGSSGAAMASQAMVDQGLEEYFSGSSDEMYYGRVRVESAAYQDDICKPSSDTISAQTGPSPPPCWRRGAWRPMRTRQAIFYLEARSTRQR